MIKVIEIPSFNNINDIIKKNVLTNQKVNKKTKKIN